MRGDLHHLFACESRCNAFRGNTPYAEFPDAQERLMSDCGLQRERVRLLLGWHRANPVEEYERHRMRRSPNSRVTAAR